MFHPPPLRRRISAATFAVLLVGPLVVAAGSIAEATVTGTVADPAFAANIGTGFDERVRVVVETPADDLLIGGGFTSFRGGSPAGLVKLHADGTPDLAFNAGLGTGFNDEVRDVVAMPNGKVAVAGAFTQLNGSSVPRGLVMLNPDGTPDTTFDAALGTGFQGGALEHVTLTSDGGLLVTGVISGLNGDAGIPQNIVKLNIDGTPDAAFNANLGSGLDNTAATVVVTPDGGLVVTGGFSLLNGAAVPGDIVKLNADGTLNTAFNANLGTGFNGTVYHINRISDGGLLVGGVFTTLDGRSANRFVKLTADGTPDSAFNANLGTGLDNWVYSTTEEADGTLVIGGAFTSLDGQSANRLARLHADGTRDTAFSTSLGTGPNDWVYTTAQTSDGRLLVGGAFTALDGRSANRLVKLTDASLSAGPVPDQSSTVGDVVDLAIPTTTTPSLPVTFSATGLPDGLTIDATSGHVTGSPTLPGTFTVQVAVQVGQQLGRLTDTAGFTWTVHAAPDATTSGIAAAPATITADGQDAATVTVTLRDADGNLTGTGGPVVTMSTDLGTLTSPTDEGDGTYTATLTSAEAGLATIGFTVNGVAGAASATVQVVAPPAPPAAPALVLEFAEREVGQPQVATGTGFAPNRLVQVTMASDPLVLGTVTTDGDGAAVFEFAVPQAATGPHTVTFSDPQGAQSASAAFTITAPDSADGGNGGGAENGSDGGGGAGNGGNGGGGAGNGGNGNDGAGTGGTGDGVLASTGQEVGAVIGLAGVLLAAGTVLLVARRRNATATSPDGDPR